MQRATPRSHIEWSCGFRASGAGSHFQAQIHVGGHTGRDGKHQLAVALRQVIGGADGGGAIGREQEHSLVALFGVEALVVALDLHHGVGL